MNKVATAAMLWACLLIAQLPARSQPVKNGQAYSQQPPTAVARIGADVLPATYADLLVQLPDLYPVRMLAPIPISRPPKINYIETELLFRDAQTLRGPIDSIKASRELEWKRRAVAANYYYRHGLRDYFGYPWSTLEQVYQQNQSHYDSVVSSEGRGLSNLSAHNIAFELFIKECPPDTALLRKALVAEGQAGLRIPTEAKALATLWAQYVSIRAANDFFLGKFFKDKYKKPLPEWLTGLVDNKEYGILAADTAMLARWQRQGLLQENQTKSLLSTDQKVGLLLRWKLFSERARTISDELAADLAIFDNLCLKYEVAFWHCRDHIVDPVKSIPVDTALVRLAYEIFIATHDSHATQSGPAAYQDYSASFIVPHHMPAIVGRINELYKKFGVTLIDPELKQSWWVGPPVLLRRADSLSRAGQDSLSALHCQYFLRDYPFLPQFDEVVFHLADLQLAHKDSVQTFEALGTLYNGLITSKEPAVTATYVKRLVEIFKGKPRYTAAENACRQWLRIRGQESAPRGDAAKSRR